MPEIQELLIAGGLGLLVYFAVRTWDKIHVSKAIRCIVEVCAALQKVTPDKVDEYLAAIETWGNKWLTENEKQILRRHLEKVARGRG
jgi:hypothetical protein